MNKFDKRRLAACAVVLMIIASGCNLSRRGAPVEAPKGNSNVGSGVKLPPETPPPPDAAGNDVVPAVQPAKNDKADTKPPAFVAPKQGSNGHGPTNANQAYRYLNGEVPSVVFEIDVVGSADPDPKALSHFESIMRQVMDKREFTLNIDSRIDGADRDYNNDEIQQFAALNRQGGQTTSQAHVYVLYVPGKNSEPSGALAYAGGDTIVMFPDKMAGAFPKYQVERAVLMHEMGHLLRLINIGYKSPRNHESPQSSHHSKNADSVMYYAIDTIGIETALAGKTEVPARYDADDLADLEDIKNGRL